MSSPGPARRRGSSTQARCEAGSAERSSTHVIATDRDVPRVAAQVVKALRLLAASAVAVPFGTPFVLAAASTAIADVTMDATSVYWTEQGPGANAGAVRKLAK